MSALNIDVSENRYIGIFHRMLLEQYRPDSNITPDAFLAGKISKFQETLENGNHSPDVRQKELGLAHQAVSPSLQAYRQAHQQIISQPEQFPQTAKANVARASQWWKSAGFWAKCAIGILLICVYVVSNLYFKAESSVQNRQQIPASSPTLMTLDVEVTDFNNKSVTVLIMPVAGRYVRENGMLDHDITVNVDGGKTMIQHTFKADEPEPPFAAEIEIDTGDILDYPFDSYEADLNIDAVSGNQEIPVKIALESIPHGLKGSIIEQHGANDDIGERLFLTRSAVGKFAIGLSVFSIVLVCASSLWVAYHLVVSGKAVGFDVLVWTAALLFVIPTVRDAMPGNPPLGSRIDFLVFFWLQAFVAVATLALVVAWYRHTIRETAAA